jgi:hypothetical protein
MGKKVQKAALAGGIVWGGCMFLTTLAALYFGYGVAFLSLMASIYPGYHISFMGSFVGLIYGFLDVYVGIYIIMWVYKKVA